MQASVVNNQYCLLEFDDIVIAVVFAFLWELVDQTFIK